MKSTDFVIIGAGVVGLTIALEIKRRAPKARVLVLEKEGAPGRHSSGRNSGVLHSGIYYPPGSLKARLCGGGAREWAEYCTALGLFFNPIGKLLVPTRAEDGCQLDVLEQRARINGVDAERLGTSQMVRIEPEAHSATGEALFVRSTAVVDPRQVMSAITEDARAAGIELLCGGPLGAIDAAARTLEWAGEAVGFGHVVNTAGLHADRVAHAFGVGRDYTMLPFKGLYWKLDPASGIEVNHLIYPVPDLRVPFLGIHTTTAPDGTVTLGPTAIPAFGRESYRGLDDLAPGEAARIAGELGKLFIAGKGGFRRLAWQEGQRAFRPAFAKAARALLPRLKPEHLLPSAKVGMRAQLLDRRSGELVNDFLVETGPDSTHVLNAVSPAFTSALPFARFVCDTNIVS